LQKEGIGVIYLYIMAEENLDEEVVAEEAAEETPEVQLPSEEILEQIFEVIAGTEFNEADQGHLAVMQQIILLLQQDPELSQDLSSGDITVSQFALKLYRDMEEQAEEAEEME
jgi:hypothetical protein